jgi:hypothetical protein
MDDRGGSSRRALDRSEFEQIRTLGEIKPDHHVAASLEVLSYGDAHVAAMPGDENAHGARIALPTTRVLVAIEARADHEGSALVRSVGGA